MALQIKTIRGRKYIYDVKSFWDKTQKKFRKHTTYMGPCINEETKEYVPKKQESIKVEKSAELTANEKLIVNYGDVHLLWEYLKQSPLYAAFTRILPSLSDSFLAMLFYKIIDGAASCYASTWLDGSYAKVFFLTFQHLRQPLVLPKTSV